MSNTTDDETQLTIPSEAFASIDSTNLTSLMLAGGPQFEHIQRVAKMFASSDLVPEQFRGKIGNCIIALEISQRIGAGALPVMQNLYIVHGKPGWSSQFLIASLNTCGRFEPLRFDVQGKDDDRCCIAWTTDKGEKLPPGMNKLDAAREAGVGVYESPPVSIKMAKDEGWHSKNGSKWKTMPELMLRYRAATFFTRLYAPEITMGMATEDEIRDTRERDITPKATATMPASAEVSVKTPQIADEQPTEPEAEPIETVVEDPEGDTLRDFLLIIDEAQDASALNAQLQPSGSFKLKEHREKAKRAIQSRAKTLGLVWSEADKTFVPA